MKTNLTTEEIKHIVESQGYQFLGYYKHSDKVKFLSNGFPKYCSLRGFLREIIRKTNAEILKQTV